MPYNENVDRPQYFNFSDPSCCASGVLINFSGVPMHPHETYTVVFDWYSTMPALPIVEFYPLSYTVTPTEQNNNHIVSTFMKSITNFNYDNSTKNVIGVRVYDSYGRFIYENIGIVKCGEICTEQGKPRFEYVAVDILLLLLALRQLLLLLQHHCPVCRLLLHQHLHLRLVLP